MAVSRTNQLLLEPSRKNLYDETNLASILDYAVRLEGTTFKEILVENGLNDEEIGYLREKSMRNKGLLGTLIVHGDEFPSLGGDVRANSKNMT